MSAHGWATTLARLALFRATPPLALAIVAVLAALLRWREESRAAELATLLAANAPSAAAAAREALWTATALVLVPFAVLRAARTFALWRAGELDFLAPRAAPRAGIVGATNLGHVGACALLVALVAAACELGRAREASLQDAGELRLPRSGWITGRAPYTASLGRAELPKGARLEVELVLGTGAGPATEVVLRLERAGASRSSASEAREPSSSAREARARVGARGRIEAEVPAGAGELVLALSLTDPDARVFLAAETARAWRPVEDARAASVVLALRLLALVVAASAVALGLAAFLSPAIAAAGTFALALVPGLAGFDPAWLPGRGLFDALDVASRARVPAWPGVELLAGAAVLAALGVVLASASRAAWRRTR
ncbi:MAG: hypothetical protein IPJ77_06905 [Planctomycetes bacterium]|nr:hypothetical protein [Planctomycetota bacterium]